MITNNNCFAYDRGECMALEVDTCEGCNFYKSYYDDFQSRRKAWKRLKELPKEQQKHIQDKYSQSKPLK